MPWTASDAKKKRDDLTDNEAKLWAKVANGALKRCLDDGGDTDACEVSAIKQAHAVVNKQRQTEDLKDMPRYNITEIMESSKATILEGSFDDEKMEFDVAIIVAGRSDNQTIYSPVNLSEIRDFINAETTTEHTNRSRKMYTNHVRVKDDEAYPGRNLQEWAASLLKSWIPENNENILYARVCITPQCEWIYKLAKDPVHDLGVSIHAGAIIERAKDAGDGKPGIVIKQVVALYSVDFVTEAAAGGRVLEDYDSKEVAALLVQAHDIANRRNDTELCSIIESIKGRIESNKEGEKPSESLYLPSPDDRIAIDPDNGKIKPFSVSIKKMQNEEDAMDIWWALTNYLRELIFLTSEADLPLRIGGGNAALVKAFTQVDELLKETPEEGINLYKNTVIVRREAITVQQIAQQDIIADMQQQGAFSKPLVVEGSERTLIKDDLQSKSRLKLVLREVS